MSQGYAIAIVGMAGRFPGAPDVRTLWRKRCAGIEAIRDLTADECRNAGVPEELLANPAFVRRSADLDGIELFDPELFGLGAEEARATDPQQRLLLELAWEAFEDACHRPDELSGAVGVFVGASRNDYRERVLASRARARLGDFAIEIANGNDFLATRLSYAFDLRGPSVTVQTACSTSLVAVHQACQSLLARECDLALAGGVSVRLPQAAGYLWHEGGVASPDGRCRAFDARAAGTVAGNGGALVLLRPLADALADGDEIHAVVRGSAVNNDGRAKVGFTAPSVAGQARAIEEALAMAEVDPETIGFVETHGTGTPLGDPVEIAALAEAFARAGSRVRAGSVAIASIKSSLGHLDAAAGIAGLVEAVLAVRHGRIPPTLHFERASPALELERTPFALAAEVREWPAGKAPRRAGVSSFGIGGTNAHVVVEEAPAARERVPATRVPASIVLSARSEAALAQAAAQLAERLEEDAATPLADVAWSLQAGRRVLAHRLALAGDDRRALARDLRALPREARSRVNAPRRAAFLFPGQGAQRARMGAALSDADPIFRAELDGLLRGLSARLGRDLAALIRAEGEPALDETRFAQPALFAVELALAQRWIALGVEPAAMLGHSIGELVAAALAGVMSPEDALDLVVARADRMQRMPRGAMLAAALPEEELRARLAPELAIASVNGPRAAVASGPEAAIAALERDLAAAKIAHKRLATSHPFHSPSMEAASDGFRADVRAKALRPPARRFLSNVTGTWITDEQATDPDYWASQLLRTVRLADGLAELVRQDLVLIEVGPGRTFGSLVRGARGERAPVVSSLPRDADGDEALAFASALGRAWAQGVAVDWKALHGSEPPQRRSLPTYPFERRHLWIDADGAALAEPVRAAAAAIAGATIEDRIAAVYADALGVPVGPSDDVHELGFSSLAAAAVLARLRGELGLALSIADVVAAATPEELARLARRSTARPLAVALGPLGPPHLFCVHGIDGDVAGFAALARIEPSLVALRAPGLEADEAPCASVEQLADAFLGEIVLRQPSGPYRILGHSFGALVAFEIARRLEQRGQLVDPLVLLDASLPGDGSPDPSRRDALDGLRAGGLVGASEDEADPAVSRRIDVVRAHARAALAYRPRPYGGAARLVLARGGAHGSTGSDAIRGWRGVVLGGLRVETAPGDHVSMLAEPHVRELLRLLGLCETRPPEQDTGSPRSAGATSETEANRR